MMTCSVSPKHQKGLPTRLIAGPLQEPVGGRVIHRAQGAGGADRLKHTPRSLCPERQKLGPDLPL